MITVDDIHLVPRDCFWAIRQPNGRWLCYMPGDSFSPIPPDEMARQMAGQYANAVQSMLDAEAQARAYDGILSMVSYAGDAHPKFGIEGAAAKAWRTACWAKCYTILAAVESGARQMPTIAELLSEMPQLVI